jgi:hypothetical protein
MKTLDFPCTWRAAKDRRLTALIGLAAFLLAAAPSIAVTPAISDLAVGKTFPSLTLPDGLAYKDVTVTKMDTDGFMIRHSAGSASIKFTQLAAAKDAPKAPATPGGASSRFGEEALALFAPATSRYFLNGTLQVPTVASAEEISRYGQSEDPTVREAAALFATLQGNEGQQSVQAKKIADRLSGHVSEKPAAPILGDSGPDTNAAEAQSTINESTELIIEHHRLGRELRAKVAAIAKRDQPKGAIVTSPLRVSFVAPGAISIINASTGSLNHCIVTTSTTMYSNSGAIDTRRVGIVVDAASAGEMKILTARAAELNKQAITGERGFLTYLPKLRGGETLLIPFCDLESLPSAQSVRLSFWSDETTSDDVTVGGLVDFRKKMYDDANFHPREGGGELSGLRAGDPLVTNEKLSLKPIIARDPNDPLNKPAKPVGK